MSAIVQADFNCPYPHLAGQRADLHSRSGVAVDLRGVEHVPRLPVTGTPVEPAAWGGELALRRRLFDAVWAEGLNVSAPDGGAGSSPG